MSSSGSNRQHFYEFGTFRLSETERVLRRFDEVLPLTPKAVDLLLMLVQNACQVLSTEDLLKSVWADCVVEPNNLQTQIAAVRKAIGKEFIKTVPKRGYQFTAEVKEMWEQPPAAVAPWPTTASAIEALPPALRSRRLLHLRIPGMVVLSVIVASVSSAGVWFALRGHHLIAPPPAIPSSGRLLASATCEGCQPSEIKLDRMPTQLLMNPSGTKAYAIERNAKYMTVVDVLDQTVKRILALPSGAYSAVMTRDGKRIYVGSSTDGVMVIDSEEDRVLGRIFPTGGRVYSVAVTSNEKKLFLAMETVGLKRISTGTGETRMLSAIACPEFVEIDPNGSELFVSYQGGGPGGRWGHDSLEIYDVESERSLAIVAGPPMVGGDPSFALGSPLVLLNGQDACLAPAYDHVGCPMVPGDVFHLLRSADRTIVRTFGMPVHQANGNGGKFVPDGRRLIFTGEALTVLDVSRQAVLEKYEGPREFRGQVAFDAAGRHAAVLSRPVGLLVLKPLDQTCLPPREGQFNLYPGDGTFDDVQQVGNLVAEGNVEFVPGVIGQAFRLNGKNSMLHVSQWGACGDCGDSWTESLFVKLDALQGEMTILERASADKGRGHRLFKSREDRIVLELGDGILPTTLIKAASPVSVATWYHYAVVADAGERRFYINGQLVGTANVPKMDPTASATLWGDVCVGATHQRGTWLAGRVDELAFYNRALPASEIKRIYELSTPGSCRQQSLQSAHNARTTGHSVTRSNL